MGASGVGNSGRGGPRRSRGGAARACWPSTGAPHPNLGAGTGAEGTGRPAAPATASGGRNLRWGVRASAGTGRSPRAVAASPCGPRLRTTRPADCTSRPAHTDTLPVRSGAPNDFRSQRRDARMGGRSSGCDSRPTALRVRTCRCSTADPHTSRRRKAGSGEPEPRPAWARCARERSRSAAHGTPGVRGRISADFSRRLPANSCRWLPGLSLQRLPAGNR